MINFWDNCLDQNATQFAYKYRKIEKLAVISKHRITDPLAFFQMFPKFMKDVYTSKCILILIKYFLKINAVFVKALILNISFSYDSKDKSMTR